MDRAKLTGIVAILVNDLQEAGEVSLLQIAFSGFDIAV
jgi:hypothetical protein